MLDFPHALPIVLLLGTLANLWFSRGALRRPRTAHGFPRAFAFQAILLLFVLNHPHWDALAGSASYHAAWALMLLSGTLALAAYLTLRLAGRHDAARDDPALVGFERTARLVQGGIFRWVRHPMYAALGLLAWGLFCKHPSPAGAALALLATGALAATAQREERECLAHFGAPYAAYLRRTRRFVPYLW